MYQIDDLFINRKIRESLWKIDGAVIQGHSRHNSKYWSANVGEARLNIHGCAITMDSNWQITIENVNLNSGGEFEKTESSAFIKTSCLLFVSFLFWKWANLNANNFGASNPTCLVSFFTGQSRHLLVFFINNYVLVIIKLDNLRGYIAQSSLLKKKYQLITRVLFSLAKLNCQLAPYTGKISWSA